MMQKSDKKPHHIKLKKVLSDAEKHLGLVLLGALSFLYLDSALDAKPALKTAVCVATVYLLVRSQLKK